MRIIIIILLFSSSAFGQTVNDLRPTVTMKEYVDGQIEMMKRLNDLRDEHQREISRIKDDNIKNAYASMDKRLDGMNEFRQTLNDSNKTYVTWQSLLALVVGISGFLFGYSNYKKNQGGTGQEKNIQSGDKVEVKK